MSRVKAVLFRLWKISAILIGVFTISVYASGSLESRNVDEGKWTSCGSDRFINPAVFAIMFLLIPFFTASTHAAETKIFTDADLEKYNAGPMVDQETASRSEADLNSYITRRSAESLLEKEAVKKEEIRRQQIEEVKRSVVRRKKVTVSQMPVSVPQKRVIAAQTTGSVQRSTGST